MTGSFVISFETRWPD